MDDELLQRYLKALDEVKELRSILDERIKEELRKGIGRSDLNEFISEYLKKLPNGRIRKIVHNKIKRELDRIKKRSSFRQLRIDDFLARD